MSPKVSATAAFIICKYNNIESKEVAKRIYKYSQKLDMNNCRKYFRHGLVNAYNSLIK